MLYLFHEDQYKAKWFTTIKSILEECSMAEVRKNELNNMTLCDLYVHLKPNFKMEKYLISLNKNQRIAISKFRTNNTCLPKVTGRFKVVLNILKYV